MGIVWNFIKSTRWFFISAIFVFIIAFGLTQISVSHTDGGVLAFINYHSIFFMCFRIFVALAFIMCWPIIVEFWGEKYNWSSGYIIEVKKRRWRYAIWFVIADLAFQLL